jgi:hypothetical protein
MDSLDTATRVLVIGGMSVLSFGLLLGIPMAAARSKAPQPPRYLFAAHLAAIIQGGLLLALSVALGISTLSAGLETAAVSILVAGVALFDLGLVTNWLQRVEDAFGEKSLGNKISGAGTPLVLIGTGILFYGVIAAL